MSQPPPQNEPSSLLTDEENELVFNALGHRRQVRKTVDLHRHAMARYCYHRRRPQQLCRCITLILTHKDGLSIKLAWLAL